MAYRATCALHRRGARTANACSPKFEERRRDDPFPNYDSHIVMY